MAETNSTKVKTSRYVTGGTSEVNNAAIEWWERSTFQTSTDDSIFLVPDTMNHRLDLIAKMFYDNETYWWFIAQYNNILDPYSEVVAGVVLRIPTLERFKSLQSMQLGGIASQRVVPTTILPIV
jgi:hypothetical protein